MIFQEFLKYVKSHLKLNGFKLKILEKQRFGGKFCPHAKEILINSANEAAMFQSLIHEYCHFKNYIENLLNSEITLTCFDLLLKCVSKKVELTKDEYKYCFEEVLRNEYQCETDSLELINTLNLEVDQKDFSQRANQNLWAYSLEGNGLNPYAHGLSEMRKMFPTKLKHLPYYFSLQNYKNLLRKNNIQV